ncbi:Rv3654c family TadE-like protein [Demequina sp.]|uniref:Rv3654c family TadE-like protein n=1 Tax=Demequina sp. TaxID=2050685 RepID=UPI0025C6A9C1|nr:Rv3654c family TadE-like protein [Demequina sp.]
MSGARHDEGSASPVIVALIAVVVVLAAAASHVGAGVIAHAQAGGAADLAALAAAQTDRDWRAQGASPAVALERACEAAKDLAHRNGATLSRCARGSGGSVMVVVRVRIPGWPDPASASSRAGPAWGQRPRMKRPDGDSG